MITYEYRNRISIESDIQESKKTTGVKERQEYR